MPDHRYLSPISEGFDLRFYIAQKLGYRVEVSPNVDGSTGFRTRVKYEARLVYKGLQLMRKVATSENEAKHLAWEYLPAWGQRLDVTWDLIREFPVHIDRNRFSHLDSREAANAIATIWLELYTGKGDE